MPGRYFDEWQVGDAIDHPISRTVTEADNLLFSALTHNPQPLHLDKEAAAKTEFGQPLVVSTLTLAVVLGLSVADTSENAAANLGWDDIQLPKPVFAGDTLWAESEVLSQELDIKRLREVLKRMREQKVAFVDLAVPSPFALPLMVERFREKLSTEKLQDRLQRMLKEMEQEAERG